MLKALVIGCGRVGSSIALQLHQEGWEVTVVDENEDALSRLGESWPGTGVVVRVLDPARARFYQERGLETVCPTSVAIDRLLEAARTCAIPIARPEPEESV